MDAHELIAAYALDALDVRDRETFEAHLRECERCREELAPLREAAASLAFSVEAPPPPERLRGRILEAVSERATVVPLRRWRRATYGASALAAAAASLALAFGLWGWSLSRDLDAERSAAAVLADPDASSIALDGAEGRLVVSSTGAAALVVSLAPAPPGRTYEAWVIRGGTPTPAGLFDGAAGRDVVVLEEPVPRGATVAVTLEPAGGVDRPTGEILVSADTRV
jgi:anti-sigma-K factor RskA